MPPTISGAFNARALLRALCLISLVLCAAAPLVPQPAHAASFSSTSSGHSTTDASSYTFPGVSLGEPTGDRLVVVSVSWRDTESNALNSVTVGGVPLTRIVEARGNGDANSSYTDNSMWTGIVPTGTTGDLVITLSNQAIRAAYAIGTINGVVAEPYDTATDTDGTTLAAAIDVPTGGAVMAFAGLGVTSYTSAAWTGATEFADSQTGGEASGYSAAVLNDANAETGRTIEVAFTVTGGLDSSLIAASFKPRFALVRPPNNLGLVGYWSFNEGTSTITTDFSGNGNHGTFSNIANPPTATSGWANGKRGKALALDSSNDIVTVPDNDSLTLSTGLMTVAFWLKKPSLGADESILWKRTAGGGVEYGVEMQTDEIQLYVAGSGFITECTNCDITANEWYFVTITWSDAANDTQFYINGIAKIDDGGTADDQSMTNTTHPFVFGEGQTNEECNCTLDDVRLYNRALSASEVVRLYGSGAVKINASSVDLQRGSTLANGLVGHWTFDGPDATDRIYDRSGPGNLGYFNGGATSSAKMIGKLGQAFSFDGTNDYVETSTITYNSSVATLAFWLEWDGYADDCDVAFAGGDTEEVPGSFFVMPNDCDFPGLFTAALSTQVGGSQRRESISRPSANEWHHYVFVFDRSTSQGDITVYLDGVLQSANIELNNGTASGNFAAEPLRMMAGSFEGTILGFGAGDVDDVRLYNRALSPAEVAQLYRLGTVRITQ